MKTIFGICIMKKAEFSAIIAELDKRYNSLLSAAEKSSKLSMELIEKLRSIVSDQNTKIAIQDKAIKSLSKKKYIHGRFE